jgi:hypothetical protein
MNVMCGTKFIVSRLHTHRRDSLTSRVCGMLTKINVGSWTYSMKQDRELKCHNIFDLQFLIFFLN